MWAVPLAVVVVIAAGAVVVGVVALLVVGVDVGVVVVDAARLDHAHDQFAHPPRRAPDVDLPGEHPAIQSTPPQLPNAADFLPASSIRKARPWTAPVLESKRCPALPDLGSDVVVPIGWNRPHNKNELQTCEATAYGIQMHLHHQQ